MLIDLLLAIAHHLAMLGLIVFVVMELVLVKPEITPAQAGRMSRIDLGYGVFAVLIVAVGFGRVYFGIKDPAFYLENHVFWTKIGLFAVMGVVSVWPSLAFSRWRRELKTNPNFRPVSAEVGRVRRFLHIQVGLLALIPIFAAMLGRGIGA